MFVSFQQTFAQKQFLNIGVVVAVWVWVAVRTKQAANLITSGTIPFSKRALWLLKILALIVGGGGAISLTEELGARWSLAILLGGVIVFFALRENVQGVVPPKPIQDASTYQKAWQEYDRLRKDYMKSLRWLVATLLALIAAFILTASLAGKSGENVLGVFFGACFAAFVVSSVIAGLRQLKWYRWACPRCGCAFRGFWGRPWLSKRCVYCGLEREERRPG